jgi:hypothetical protein
MLSSAYPAGLSRVRAFSIENRPVRVVVIGGTKFLGPHGEARQPRQDVQWHRPWEDIAAHDDLVDSRPTDVVEHRLQRGQVALTVEDRRHAHAV